VPTTPAQIGDFASLPQRIEDAPAAPDERTPPQPPLVSSAPEAPKLAQPAGPVVQVKAATPVADQAADAPKPQARQEPKPLKPKDEQAEADAMIDAILADMQKAQSEGAQ
jgi:hypothetical protein